VKSVPRGKARPIWNANGGFVSVLLTHLFYFSFLSAASFLLHVSTNVDTKMVYYFPASRKGGAISVAFVHPSVRRVHSE